ncbi:GNAT family N-acetyltransferase [Pseudomaricurvus alkylphenolicus]|uniref:GNAT family N-acetyltransferase n=1 Tax=Pseudomaricurvus alkylphenolicus TaxID=1306991 RepID=UPI00197DBD81|nr:GNAT family N-acetyltransferase [Pseudomaricurvus alkylphenolicus]
MKVEIVTVDSHYQQLAAIRQRVFTQEQGVPESLEFDDRDPHCVQVLITDKDEPIACGRIDLEKGGKVGRVAVQANARHLGLGRKVMQALEQAADDAGLDKVWFHAQKSAVGFYEKLGYHCVGEEFLEAGIVHRQMEKSLD